jgi:hypothetical protein
MPIPSPVAHLRSEHITRVRGPVEGQHGLLMPVALEVNGAVRLVCGSTANWMAVRKPAVSGSRYVRSTSSGSVMIVSGLELARITR